MLKTPALPHPTHTPRTAGLVGCLILSAVVAALEGFTMYVLAKFAERYDADSYGQLIRRALGRKTAAGLSTVLLCYLWGSCVAYLVIVADTFTNLAAQYMGPDALAAQRPFVLLVTGALVLLMCFPRHLQALGEPHQGAAASSSSSSRRGRACIC
jgi:amino acid permease